MRVAIPLFGDQVSPRFGPGRHFMLASIEDGQIQEKQLVEAQDAAQSQLPTFLASLGVTKLICGGIQHQLQRDMECHGIDVIWGIIGPASEALCALANGTLHNDQFVGRESKARTNTSSSKARAGGHPP